MRATVDRRRQWTVLAVLAGALIIAASALAAAAPAAEAPTRSEYVAQLEASASPRRKRPSGR